MRSSEILTYSLASLVSDYSLFWILKKRRLVKVLLNTTRRFSLWSALDAPHIYRWVLQSATWLQRFWNRFSLISFLWNDMLLCELRFRSHSWTLLKKMSTTRCTSSRYTFEEVIADDFESFLQLSTMIYTMRLTQSRLERLLIMQSWRIVR